MDVVKNQGVVWLHIAAFLSGKATLTRVTYLGVLKEFLFFLKQGEEIQDNDFDKLLNISPIDAARYLEWLRNKPGINPRQVSHDSLACDLPSSSDAANCNMQLVERRPSRQRMKFSDEVCQSSASIRKKIAILRKLYKVLQAAGLVKANPFASELLTVPKSGSEKRPTEMIDFNLVREIVEAARDQDNVCGYRDSCLLAFLFGLGLRRSEAVKILMTDFKTSPEGTKYVRLRKTKSGRDDVLPLNSFVEQYLTEWLNKRAEFGVKSVFLFPAIEGKKRQKVKNDRGMSTTTVWRIFKKACRKIGLLGRFSPHSARATAITKLLSEGWDFKSVQSFSRHSSIIMVERYDKRRMQIEQNPSLKLRF